MQLLFTILLHIIVPIFILIGVGVLLHRIFNFDMNTFSKLITYLFIPVFGFVNIYEGQLKADLLLAILVFFILHNGILIAIVEITSRVFKFDRKLASTYKNSVVLNNSGNFGIPVSQLVFAGNPLGQSIQFLVLVLQNLLTYTYGLMNAISSNTTGIWGVLKQFFKLPMIYALILGFIFNIFSIEIPTFIWSPIESITDAFLAIALIALGAQSAYLKIQKPNLPLVLSITGRLLISPLVALGFIYLLQLEGTIAQGLFIASAFPSSRHSAQFALEFKNYPEFAAQAVIVSTVLSGVTVTIAVYLAKLLF